MDNEITFVDPGTLEGEPDEVREAALHQLDLTLATLDELVEATEIQVRNAFMSDILGRRGRPTAMQINDDRNMVEQWEDSAGGRWFQTMREDIADMRLTLAGIRMLGN